MGEDLTGQQATETARLLRECCVYLSYASDKCRERGDLDMADVLDRSWSSAGELAAVFDRLASRAPRVTPSPGRVIRLEVRWPFRWAA